MTDNERDEYDQLLAWYAADRRRYGWEMYLTGAGAVAAAWVAVTYLLMTGVIR